MRVVIQRCKQSQVTVDQEITGKIAFGIVALVGIAHDDTQADVQYVADKIANLRIFEDEQGKMNLSLLDVGGSLLSVSQFTLYGDCSKGRRPNFMSAARPETAEPLYDLFNETLRRCGIDVQTGLFGAMMEVSLVNDGPVTLIVESREKDPSKPR